MTRHRANVLLVIPAAPDTLGRREERMGVAYLAGVLAHVGHDVRILDSQAVLGQAGYRREAGCIAPDVLEHDFKTLAMPLVERDWDVIGFSVLSCEIPSCAELVRFLRKNGSHAHVTLGGETPTMELRWIFDDVEGIDSVVVGEGEITLLELVDAIVRQKDWRRVSGLAWREGGQIKKSPPRTPILDLDLLPYPDRQTLPVMKKWQPMANVTSSRDCFFRCTYCSVRRFWGNQRAGWRVRRPGAVVEEIADVQRRFGISDFTFTDPVWMGAGSAGRRNARAFAEELIERELGIHFRVKVRADSLNAELMGLLKQAGLNRVGVGVESVWQPTLDYWKKDETVENNINTVKMVFDAGIDLDLGFIMFHPAITLDEFDTNVHFLRGLLDVAPRPDLTLLYAYYTKIIPFRGTEVYDQLIQDGMADASGHYELRNPQAAEVARGLWDHLRFRLRPLYYPLIQWELAVKRLRMETGDDTGELEFGEVVRALARAVADFCESLSAAARRDAVTDAWIQDRLRDFDRPFQRAEEAARAALTAWGGPGAAQAAAKRQPAAERAVSHGSVSAGSGGGTRSGGGRAV